MPVAERTLRHPEGWMDVRGTPALSLALRAGAASPRRAPLTILGAGGVRVPRPAPATTRGASLLHCLRVRKAERTRTRSGMSPCVCLSVCPPPPTYVVSPQSLTDGKGRGDMQTCRSHHEGPLCLSRLLQQVPPTPDKSIGHRITPRGALVASAWRSPSLREAEGTPRAVTAAPPQGLSSGVTGSGPLLVLPVAAAPAVPRASAWRRTGEPTGGAPAFLGRHGEGRCPWSALGDTWLSG